nr:hydroxyacid dehydrogenase [uncultured Cohaesibacter sp.]
MDTESMSAEKQKILVTRSRIDSSAVDLLSENGFECIFSPPYAKPEEVIETAKSNNVCAIMVSQGKITDAVIRASGNVKVIAKHGSGVNNINIAAAEKLGIPVYRAAGANARAVAEHAIALILSLRKSLPYLSEATRGGNWLKGSFIGKDFGGTKLGLIGFGAIGREVASMAMGLGMEISVFDPALLANGGASCPEGVTAVAEMDDIICNCDVISLHCPLVPATRHLVNSEFLKKMQPHAAIVNTARGGMIDEDALADALESGEIAGAGVDSFEQEPPVADAKLFKAPNLIVTPHAAGLTPGAERNMATMAARFIIDHLEGREINPAFLATSAALGGLQE